MGVSTITPREFEARRASGQAGELIDVRMPVEFREVHAAPARNIPLHELDSKVVATARLNREEPLYFICRSGGRGRQACERLIAAGLERVVNVEGGTLAWEKCGLPVVRGRRAVSLERQVRIAAGTLIVLGILLAGLVHPAFVGLSAFIGAGLVFSGVTDTCGMGRVLSWMPWNKVLGQNSLASCPVDTVAAPSVIR